MRTLCLNCGVVLTNGGERVRNAVFDSSLPSHRPSYDNIWARCEVCHTVALARVATASKKVTKSKGKK